MLFILRGTLILEMKLITIKLYENTSKYYEEILQIYTISIFNKYNILYYYSQNRKDYSHIR